MGNKREKPREREIKVKTHKEGEIEMLLQHLSPLPKESRIMFKTSL